MNTNNTSEIIIGSKTTEVQVIKEKLLDLVYWFFTIFMWFVLAASLYRSIELEFRAVNTIQITLTFAFLLIFFFRKKLAFKTKSNIILALIYIIGASSIFTFGLFSQGMYFLLLLPILAGILYTNKVGYFAFAFTVSTLVIISVLSINFLTPHINTQDYTNSVTAWTISILLFSLTTLVILLFWQNIFVFLADKIENATRQESTLNKVNKLLSKEIENRKEAEILLRQNNKKTKVAKNEYDDLNQTLQKTFNELEETKKQLNDAKEKAQESDILKANFLTNISHEIRTPMNAIVGFATLMAQNELPCKDNKKYLDIILLSSNNLLNTISDILVLSRIESGQISLFPQTIDLSSFVDNLQEEFTREVYIQKGNDVSIAFNNEFQPNTKVISDLENLNHIANKIIANAIKFTQKGHIKITNTLNSNYVFSIIVEDTGIGIKPDMQTNIFDVFRQVDNGQTRKYEGTGIGLSIAKGLVNILNGTISFESELNKGTKFIISIPVENQN